MRLLLAVLLIVSAAAHAQSHPTYPTRDPHTVGYVRATQLPDGALPPDNQNGNFILGPTHNAAPEMSVHPGVPQGRVVELTLTSQGDPYYPGIARDPGTPSSDAGMPDRHNPAKLDVTTSHAHPWTRTVTVYIDRKSVV